MKTSTIGHAVGAALIATIALGGCSVIDDAKDKLNESGEALGIVAAATTCSFPLAGIALDLAGSEMQDALKDLSEAEKARVAALMQGATDDAEDLLERLTDLSGGVTSGDVSLEAAEELKDQVCDGTALVVETFDQVKVELGVE